MSGNVDRQESRLEGRRGGGLTEASKLAKLHIILLHFERRRPFLVHRERKFYRITTMQCMICTDRLAVGFW